MRGGAEWSPGVGDRAEQAEQGLAVAGDGGGAGAFLGVQPGGRAERILFYVGVPDVEAALRDAEKLGGTRRLGPVQAPGGGLVIGHFTDPQGNLIGLAAVG